MSKYVSQNPRPIYFDTIICVLSASGTAISCQTREICNYDIANAKNRQ